MIPCGPVLRYLAHRGYDVQYVRNFTDIDDKIIEKAEAEGVEPPTPRGPIVAERPIVAIRRQAGADPLVERFVETLRYDLLLC